MANDNNNMEEDEQFNQAFGEHSGLGGEIRAQIYQIKDNAYECTSCYFTRYGEHMSVLAWKLLGRYIANNAHLTKLVLEDCHLTNEKMASLFYEMTCSISLRQLDLDNNEFGIEGVRCMIPFLQNSPNLSILYLAGNSNINSECFGVLISALEGRSLQELYLYSCNIKDISALDTYNLPNLESLSLTDSNKLGREGIISLSNQIQKDDTRLTTLDIDNTEIGDEGAEILAASLKQNTKLETLSLRGSNITERGHRAFLCLLNDISSIESTYTSNHTLTALNLYYSHSTVGTIGLINSAIKINKNNPSSQHAAGRAKVIKYQLDSQKRKEMCRLQGVEYSSIGNLFADIEPALLPTILELIGENHGRSELYATLIHTAPDLLSYIDRKALIDSEMAKVEFRCAELKDEYERKIAALKTEMLTETSRLNDKKADLSRRLTLIDSGDMKQSVVGEEGNGMVGSSKKRQRR